MFLSEETERPCSLALFIFRPPGPCAKIIKKNLKLKDIFLQKELINVLQGPAEKLGYDSIFKDKTYFTKELFCEIRRSTNFFLFLYKFF